MMNRFLRFSGIRFELPETLPVVTTLLASLLFFLSLLLIAGLVYLRLPKATDLLVGRVTARSSQAFYQQAIAPDRGWLAWAIVLTAAILTLQNAADLPPWLRSWEFPLSLLLAANLILLGFSIFRRFFDDYLLAIAVEDENAINSELLTLTQFVAKAGIILVVVFIFAQTHQINLIGLVASVGVGGVAIAFASQKAIEQIIWSIILYIDRPFVVDDYIHLPDRTLGRVESIGWRSTKIRLSGRNTLAIVPNSNLAQINIENLTRAKRLISMVNLTFLGLMSDEEKALIQKLILSSTREILGIDHKLTKVNFQNVVDESGQERVQAQVIFFILGNSDTAMELRQDLLEIARDSILKRLQEYGADFNLEESIVDIAQPMNM